MIDYSNLIGLFLYIILGFFAITSSLIGVIAYNKNKNYQEKNINKFNFIMISFVLSIVLLILSIIFSVLKLIN